MFFQLNFFFFVLSNICNIIAISLFFILISSNESLVADDARPFLSDLMFSDSVYPDGHDSSFILCMVSEARENMIFLLSGLWPIEGYPLTKLLHDEVMFPGR